MTLFTVEGDLGTLIVIVSSLLWIGGVVDSARIGRYGRSAAIAILNFPAAILWFALRPLVGTDDRRSDAPAEEVSPERSFEDAAKRMERLARDARRN